MTFYLGLSNNNNNNKSFYSPQHFSYKHKIFTKNYFWDERGIACSIRAFSGFPLGMNKKNRKCLAQPDLEAWENITVTNYQGPLPYYPKKE